MQLLNSQSEANEWFELPISHKIEMLRRLKGMPSRSKSQQWLAPSQLRNSKTGRNYSPNHPNKLAFHLSGARVKALLGGYGAGKTSAGAIEAYKRIRAGEPGAIVSPDNSHFEKSAGEEFAAWFPWEHLIKQNVQKRWWLFDTGAKVYYGGIDDPESWEGPNLNWVWFDEAARKRDKRAFDVLLSRVRIGKNPQLFMTTTPRPHWLQRLLVTEPMIFEGKCLTDYWSISTIDNASNLDPLYYATLASTFTGNQAKQNLLGEFVGYEGVVYADDFSMSLWPSGNVTIDEPEKGAPIELAFDDGYIEPRAFLFIQKQPNRVLVFDEFYHTKHLAEKCVQEMVLLCKEKGWSLPEMAVGSHEAPELREHLRLADVPARFRKSDPLERIKHLRGLFCDANGVRTIAINPRCKNLLLELGEKFVYPEPDGKKRRDDEAPIWKDDHAAQALDMWCYLRS